MCLLFNVFSICRTNTNQTKSTFRYRFTHQHLLPIASQEKTPRSWSWMEPCRFRDKCDMSPPIWKLKLVAGSCVDLQMIFWYVVPCFPGKYGIIHDNTTNIIQYKCLMSWNFWVGHDLFLGYIFRHHQKWVCSWDHLWRKSQVASKKRWFYRTGKQRQAPRALGKEGETGLGGTTQRNWHSVTFSWCI